MKVLQLLDRGVQAVRRTHPDLLGKGALARGTFSVVFEGTEPGRVLKLTLDETHYVYMTDGLAPTGPHKPVLFQDYGVVGNTGAGTNLYLLEVERLAPLPRVDRGRRAIARFFRDTAYSDRLEGEEAHFAEYGMSASLANFFSQLCCFASNFSFAVDRAVGQNYMRRLSDGMLVASDPVYDRAQMEREARRRYSTPLVWSPHF